MRDGLQITKGMMKSTASPNPRLPGWSSEGVVMDARHRGIMTRSCQVAQPSIDPLATPESRAAWVISVEKE